MEYRRIDKERGIVQITTPDERWYANKPTSEMDKLKIISQEDFYPSVTWIASYYPKGAAFERWQAEKGIDKAEEVKNAAGEKGTRVHHACEDLIMGTEIKIDAQYADRNGELKELTAEEYWTTMTFRKFLEDEKPFVLGIEYTIINDEFKFGGTVDIKCRIKSDNYQFVHIIDIKTSKAIYPSHKIQLSAYRHSDKDCEKTDILQVGYKLNKNGYKLTEIPDKFSLFLNVRGTWEEEQGDVVIPQRDYPLSLTWEPLKAIPAVENIKVVAQ